MTKLAETLGLTDVQNEIIATVRQFVEKEVIPNAPELERTDTYPQAIVDQMREMGLFGLMIPQEYGGLGESLLTYALCVEELARGWMSISGVLNTHFIVAYMLRQHGTDEQKQRFLPRMAAGEIRGSFSMSEPELGSDVAAIRTRATRGSDGDYTINGQKMWLTNGASSSLVAVLVRTDEGAEAPHRNLTAFLIEKPTGFGEALPGLLIPGKIDKLGYKGIDTTELIFDGYAASADDVLGGVPTQHVLRFRLLLVIICRDGDQKMGLHLRNQQVRAVGLVRDESAAVKSGSRADPVRKSRGGTEHEGTAHAVTGGPDFSFLVD